MKTKTTSNALKSRSGVVATTVRSILLGAPLALTAASAMAESHGYVISWFATSTYNKNWKEACPEDRNGGGLKTAIRNFVEIGIPREQATEMANDPALPNRDEIQQRVATRAVVNGKPAVIYNYPDAVKDPNIETVGGPYAYGFDLGGKAANKFTDPETGKKIDNQLFRAVGCTESYRATPPQMPYPEELSWNTMTDSAPAWVIQVTGADLSRDGEVTVTISRAIQHLERDASGGIISGSTYVLEPRSRSHNVLKGEIRDGVLTVVPADIYLEGEMPFYSEIAMKKAHMRFKKQPDGKLLSYWGGYIDWQRFAYMYTARPANGADTMGIYHAVKKMADGDPDPKTGQNRQISATFRMEAVPAFIAQLDGKIVAVPPGVAAAVVRAPSEKNNASSGAK